MWKRRRKSDPGARRRSPRSSPSSPRRRCSCREFQVTLMNYIGLATMIALGLVLLTGVAGVMSFGQQVFAGLAAYATAVLTRSTRLRPGSACCSAWPSSPRCRCSSAAITLRLSGHYLPISHHRLGHRHLLHVRQHGAPRQAHRPAGPAADFLVWSGSKYSARKIYYLIWVIALALLVALGQPARLAHRPRHPRAALPRA